ncbi:type II secretion system minor pseudopilin GspK [Luteimonas sp. MC1895]|uniref:type II secretion system minor pseudopilin GspK n=1 Tax=Luteimonas sp. MC1895 TaxID=2819513 RepID=UPI0018F06866|nr:type II secretion system minor pseudopilin GspK [Luteimonas sp. MC1895]MBJ6978315.1 type II secretion system minor pseudopilin GspK [Luteimonas sp. MC1895]
MIRTPVPRPSNRPGLARRRAPRRAAQSGAALLTVLLLVAVMTVLLVAVMDDIRFALRRTGNAQALAQAQWYALGSEQLARARIHQLDRDGRTTLAGGWNGRPFLFPIDGGVMQVRLDDASACFNLNSVVEGAPGQWRRREAGVQQYLALLEALEFDTARANAMADALVDWIDQDPHPGPAGAEDPAYAARSPGARTSGALLAEASELRAIAAHDAAAYARLRPHVCAQPEAALSPINVNTLQDGDAVLLAMLGDNRLDTAAARRVLAARPAGGWPDLQAFAAQPAIRAAGLPDHALQQISLRTRWFALETRVEHAGAEVVLSALFDRDSQGPARLVARRWTHDE